MKQEITTGPPIMPPSAPLIMSSCTWKQRFYCGTFFLFSRTLIHWLTLWYHKPDVAFCTALGDENAAFETLGCLQTAQCLRKDRLQKLLARRKTTENTHDTQMADQLQGIEMFQQHSLQFLDRWFQWNLPLTVCFDFGRFRFFGGQYWTQLWRFFRKIICLSLEHLLLQLSRHLISCLPERNRMHQRCIEVCAAICLKQETQQTQSTFQYALVIFLHIKKFESCPATVFAQVLWHNFFILNNGRTITRPSDVKEVENAPKTTLSIPFTSLSFQSLRTQSFETSIFVASFLQEWSDPANFSLRLP